MHPSNLKAISLHLAILISRAISLHLPELIVIIVKLIPPEKNQNLDKKKAEVTYNQREKEIWKEALFHTPLISHLLIKGIIPLNNRAPITVVLSLIFASDHAYFNDDTDFERGNFVLYV